MNNSTCEAKLVPTDKKMHACQYPTQIFLSFTTSVLTLLERYHFNFTSMI